VSDNCQKRSFRDIKQRLLHCNKMLGMVELYHLYCATYKHFLLYKLTSSLGLITGLRSFPDVNGFYFVVFAQHKATVMLLKIMEFIR